MRTALKNDFTCIFILKKTHVCRNMLP